MPTRLSEVNAPPQNASGENTVYLAQYTAWSAKELRSSNQYKCGLEAIAVVPSTFSTKVFSSNTGGVCLWFPRWFSPVSPHFCPSLINKSCALLSVWPDFKQLDSFGWDPWVIHEFWSLVLPYGLLILVSGVCLSCKFWKGGSTFSIWVRVRLKLVTWLKKTLPKRKSWTYLQPIYFFVIHSFIRFFQEVRWDLHHQSQPKCDQINRSFSVYQLGEPEECGPAGLKQPKTSAALLWWCFILSGLWDTPSPTGTDWSGLGKCWAAQLSCMKNGGPARWTEIAVEEARTQ